MDGFAVDVNGDERAGGRRENGDSRGGSHAYGKHRRSKSATDRNLNTPRRGVPHALQNDFNGTHENAHSERTSRARSPLHECSINPSNDIASKHRVSLEKDIEELQLHLQQEKSMRILLERAMGRASSTLSPGHRHFAVQTKELIAEIELLEEEVANREQHVLSLYRSIFEHCVSQPTSKQSSGLSSPAHIKNESRKHPSIISSAFCSSKKFPLRSFQALASINDSRKRTLSSQSKRTHASMLHSKANSQQERTQSNHCKEKLPIMGKPSVPRTLKDHLYQCPSKLSEEMVRGMAAVYCWLHSSASANLSQNQLPLLSRSSTNIVLPRRGINEGGDWCCKSMVEIASLTTNKHSCSQASYAIENYRLLVEQLERVNVTQMETNAKIAFWINTYNSLLMHAYLAYGIPHSSLKRLALFHKAAYNIGGHIISANTIEQSIFCFRTPRIGRWFEIILSTAMRKRSGEERQLISKKFSLPNTLPLVCFALCTGALSDPALRVYTASNVKEELEVAAREFLQVNVVVKKSKKIFLPKVLERFAKEASISSDDLVDWVAENVDKKLCEAMEKCLDRKTSRKTSHRIEWLPYSSRFRYILSEDLMQKPWWA